MLDREIKRKKGKYVLAYVDGLDSYSHNSNLYREIKRLGLDFKDKRKRWDVAVGAHKRNWGDGWKMAIISLKRKYTRKQEGIESID